jgi:hypothetical protein
MFEKPLSPSTQAVKDAVLNLYKNDKVIRDSAWKLEKDTVVVVLRAAAYAILPLDSPHIEDFPEDDDDSPSDRIKYLKKRIRHEFLAIANELEGKTK